MIVVALIALVLAIAIPNLLEARKRANEGSAVGIMKSIISAQTLFRERDLDDDGALDYATAMYQLGPQGARLLALEKDQAMGYHQSGYKFRVASPPGGRSDGNPYTWRAAATPIKYGKTGDLSYFVDQTGVIRYARAQIDVDALPADALPIMLAWEAVGN